jgi:hypothetical protein
MITIDPAWAGKVQFYELLFGAWTVYPLLVLFWERIVRRPLAEWRYVVLNIAGGGAFCINHFLQFSPLWMALLNTYTVIFLLIWWYLGVRGDPRGLGWKLGAMAGAIAYTVAFIGFEQLARAGNEQFGVNEFWWVLASYLGLAAVAIWRGRAGGGHVHA